MSATDELRRMLDERGVEWSATDTYRLLVTSWNDASGHSWAFVEHKDGNFSKLTAYHLTPEQAIAATLGKLPYDELLRCLKNDWHISASWDGLRKFWNIELTEDGVQMRDSAWVERTCKDVSENPLRFECSACGGLSLDIAPRYCPACGAEVKLHHGERRAD